MTYGEPSCEEEYNEMMEAEAAHEAEMEALAAQGEAEAQMAEEGR